MEAKHKLNRYVCEACKVATYTLNLGHGVTPFILHCKNPGCCGESLSKMYRFIFHKPANISIEVSHFFYRPSREHILRHSMDTLEHFPQITKHLLSGGLICSDYDHAELNLTDPITSVDMKGSVALAALVEYYADFN